MGRPFTVTPKIIEIMNSSTNKSMTEVVFQIMSSEGLNETQARGYYVRLVQSGKAKGKIEYKRRGRKSTNIVVKQNYVSYGYVLNGINDLIDPDFDNIDYLEELNKEYKYDENY